MRIKLWVRTMLGGLSVKQLKLSKRPLIVLNDNINNIYNLMNELTDGILISILGELLKRRDSIKIVFFIEFS